MDIVLHYNVLHHFDQDNHHHDLIYKKKKNFIFYFYFLNYIPQTHDDGIHRPLAHRN